MEEVYAVSLAPVHSPATGGILFWMTGGLVLLLLIAGWIVYRKRQQKWKQRVEQQLGELTAQIRFLLQERERLVRQRPDRPDASVASEAIAPVSHTFANPAARDTTDSAASPFQNVAEESDDELLLRKRALEIVNEYYKDSGFGVEEFCRMIAAEKIPGTNHKLQEARRFIRTFRLNAAYELILKNRISRSMNIAEIAYEVGFNDPKYFTRCFTRLFGVSPKEVLLGKDMVNTGNRHSMQNHVFG